MVAKLCKICGTEFEAIKAAVTCSVECRNKNKAEWKKQYHEENREKLTEQKKQYYEKKPGKTCGIQKKIL